MRSPSVLHSGYLPVLDFLSTGVAGYLTHLRVVVNVFLGRYVVVFPCWSLKCASYNNRDRVPLAVYRHIWQPMFLSKMTAAILDDIAYVVDSSMVRFGIYYAEVIWSVLPTCSTYL